MVTVARFGSWGTSAVNADGMFGRHAPACCKCQAGSQGKAVPNVGATLAAVAGLQVLQLVEELLQCARVSCILATLHTVSP